MAKNLVIVESPAKAKTIAGFLGTGYRVESSYGHVRDLPKKDFGVDVKKNFQPTYETTEDKKKIVSALKKAASGATIWLASDGDREGEAIAWHVCAAIGVKPDKAKRIVFHEITKPAIAEAVAHPRSIDMKLVEAQQARRVLDRLVGYELSPILWRKVRTGLSAGRVQSVAVRLIVEREREIKAFEHQSEFKVTATFSDKQEFEAELSERIESAKKAKLWLGEVKQAKYKVADIVQKPGSRSPAPPFTTSTLQQEAGRRLGYSVRQTMILAQRLYEAGHITYMRTDSTNLSPLAIGAASDYITKSYGKNYLKTRQYQTKAKLAQEAHEAVRPSHIAKEKAGADPRQTKLYELIWKRFVASQMAPAAIKRTEATIDISGKKEKFVATGEVLEFDGYLKVYGGGKDDRLLPTLKVGQALQLKQITALETFARPPARYSEPSLVKKLEELGIGRPSTYAPTIGTIQDRGYIEKGDADGSNREAIKFTLQAGKLTETKDNVSIGADKNKLLPTTLAEIVTDFLVKYFGGVVDYGFTAKAEDELDDIAAGKLAWQQMLKTFYSQFHPLVAKSEKATRAEVSQARTLGKDKKTGLPVIARFGRYGPVLQLGESAKNKDDNETPPRFAPLPEGASLEDVTLTQALPMFDLPREVGKTADGEVITADIGRFGPYVQVDKLFVSIKDHDPLKITETQARELIAAKQKAQKEKVIADFGKIKVLNGPYGPYVTDGRRNARIPKDDDPKKITEKAAEKLLDESPSKKRWPKQRK